MAYFYILSTGTELSTGRSTDANGPFLAERLEDEGYSCAGISLLPDDASILKEHIGNLLQSENISFIIITGGLGPTADDLTVDVLADISGKQIVEDEMHLLRLKNIIQTKRGRLQLETARRQVRVLEDSHVLVNDTGLAPGILQEFTIRSGIKLTAAMPGYPQEMKPMFEMHLLPELKKRFPPENKFRKDFFLYGISESAFQKDFIEKNADDEIRSWGVAARNAHLKIFIESGDESSIQAIYNKAEKQYKHALLDSPVIKSLHSLMIAKNITVGGAESCTGGLLGKLLTDLPGSSNYFKGCIVSYSNEIKIKTLGVSNETIETFGAVSEECASEMARGAKEILETDYTFAVTGIAGPGGGSGEKPVGTVWMSLFDGENFYNKKLFFPVDRDRIRMNTAHITLFHLYRMMLDAG